MFAAFDANSLERLLLDADDRARYMGMMLEEVTGDRACKTLDRVERMLFRQREGNVFHRVGGNDQAVVAAGVGPLEIAFEARCRSSARGHRDALAGA